ncbi:hypothetical protein SAMN05446037_10546 [Anaerovirgula multivorans]|uniref:BREX-3 system P-loop-containing protein BrxF n=1 Tax=Anaerovirgula multivorans TaxID=312168 RepID=A0A239KTG4_9FIRM|nr:BREX-3 system P-loop-containing protein BrxF [Anaerovirgula multivorans]SNT21646.1 hypothetical protein SAMN05446037_10546 [Anaerovirgula multivorans]
MAEIYSKYNVDFERIRMKNIPVISCVPVVELCKIYNFEEVTTVDLGLELSSTLKEISIDKRYDSVQKGLDNIFRNLNSNSLMVVNIDILFNPSYKLNVLKYFINLARTKMVLVHWPGEIKGNVLQYSQINYADYVRYDLQDYGIACIK